MPWREVCSMDEKVRLMAALLAGEESVTVLCEDFGISRKTAYKWLTRYRLDAAAGLRERSHAPRVVPWAISQAQAEAIVGVRREHPSWGPRKLRAKLSQRAPGQSWPAASTMGELLRRQGLSQPRKRRRSASPGASPLRTAVAPNDTWCIDFKGWFRTGDGVRCDPLTLSDAYSRYLLGIKVVDAPGHADCRRELTRVFMEYGLPQVIRSDNGAPFASVGAGGLSRLSAWWVKLGITPERIEPGKPAQNGRHERMHRTLKAECASPPAATGGAQQRAASMSSATSSTTSVRTRRWGRPRRRSTTRRRRAAIRPGSSRPPIPTTTNCAGCAAGARSNGRANWSTSARL